MEKLKIVLVGVVLLLAAAVAYGLIDGGGEEGSETGATVVESPPATPPASTPEATPIPQSGAGQAGGDAESDGDGKNSGKGQGGSAAGDGDGNGGGNAEPNGRGQKSPADDPQPDAAASKAAFVKRANRICATLPARFAKRAARVQRDAGGSEPDPADMIRRVAAPVLLEAAGDLDRLTPPAGGESGVEALVAALRGVAKTVRSAPSSELLADDSSFAEFAKLARGLGLDACGRL